MTAVIKEAARTVSDLIEAEREWAPVLREGHPRWYGRLVTSIAMALGDDPVSYLSASFRLERGLDDQSQSFAAEVAVFTETFLVHAQFDGQADAVDGFNLLVIPRAALNILSVSTSGDAVANESFDPFAGRTIVDLAYKGHGNVALTLPLAASDRVESRKDLLALFASLRNDLR